MEIEEAIQTAVPDQADVPLPFTTRVIRSYAWTAGSFAFSTSMFVATLFLSALMIGLAPLCGLGLNCGMTAMILHRVAVRHENRFAMWAVQGCTAFEFAALPEDFKQAQQELFTSATAFKLYGYYFLLRPILGVLDLMVLLVCSVLPILGVFAMPAWARMRVNHLGWVVPKRSESVQLTEPIEA